MKKGSTEVDRLAWPSENPSWTRLGSVAAASNRRNVFDGDVRVRRAATKPSAWLVERPNCVTSGSLAAAVRVTRRTPGVATPTNCRLGVLSPAWPLTKPSCVTDGSPADAPRVILPNSPGWTANRLTIVRGTPATTWNAGPP